MVSADRQTNTHTEQTNRQTHGDRHIETDTQRQTHRQTGFERRDVSDMANNNNDLLMEIM